MTIHRRAAAWLRRCWARPKPLPNALPWSPPAVVVVADPDGSLWRAEPDWRRISDPPANPGDLS